MSQSYKTTLIGRLLYMTTDKINTEDECHKHYSYKKVLMKFLKCLHKVLILYLGD